jgi:hypothetical protein
MSPHLKKEPMHACPSCGTLNRLASPFCKQCGDRMYKGGGEPPRLADEKKVGAGAALRNALRALLLVSVLAAVGLVFWPAEPSRIPKGRDPSRQLARFAEAATQAVEKGYAIPSAVFLESQVNAFLTAGLPADSSREIGVAFSGSGILLVSREPLGPLALQSRLLLEPDADSGYFLPAHFWLGHLPLPPRWSGWWLQGLQQRFAIPLDPAIFRALRVDRVDNERARAVDIRRPASP